MLSDRARAAYDRQEVSREAATSDRRVRPDEREQERLGPGLLELLQLRNDGAGVAADHAGQLGLGTTCTPVDRYPFRVGSAHGENDLAAPRNARRGPPVPCRGVPHLHRTAAHVGRCDAPDVPPVRDLARELFG
jgi:hypothetical protein